jgi:cysteine synthase/rhodanese-related sulfurtransferase
MLARHISELIGNTPVLEIDPSVHGLKNINLFAKLELLNPMGSVKDKSAWNVLKDHISEIKERKQTVIESSSGNMAKAIQTLCSVNDIPFKIVTNRIKVREVKQILQLLGAQIDELPGLSECPDQTDPNDPLTFIERMMSGEPGKYFHTTQYTNENNIRAHYEATGREIQQDLGRVDYFFGGLGSTGSTRGAGTFLKEQNPNLKVIGVIASKGQMLPGIRNVDEMFEVGLFRKDFYDGIIEVNTDESLDAMLLLIRKVGVMAGPTGGGSLAAALKYLKEVDTTLTEKKNAVFIVCDRVEWYLSYLQKARPELFGVTPRKDSIKALTKDEANKAPELSVEQASKWLQRAPKPLVVDMRGSLAFRAAHIPGSINIPGETMEDLAEWGVPFSNEQNVLFVCPVGDQSKKFAAFFAARGIDCASLSGGYTAWRDAGMLFEKSATASLAAVR